METNVYNYFNNESLWCDMPREIDLSLLRAFVAVAQTRNMTVAGRHLNLTQAAVSQQIKRLEEQFDQELFDRRQRGLRLTHSGERLVSYAERILSQNDEIWGVMTAPAYDGKVRLGVPHDIVGPFMPPILRNFAMSWPQVEVELVCTISSELLQDLAEGEIDLTLTTEASTGKGGELLLADQLVWVGGPAGTAHERTPLPLSLGDDHCAFRAAAARVLASVGRDWRSACAVGNMSALTAAVEADLAVAPLLSQTVPDNLEILGPESGLPSLPTYYINLYQAPTQSNPIAQELARQIKQSFAARYPQAA